MVITCAVIPVTLELFLSIVIVPVLEEPVALSAAENVY